MLPLLVLLLLLLLLCSCLSEGAGIEGGERAIYAWMAGCVANEPLLLGIAPLP